MKMYKIIYSYKGQHRLLEKVKNADKAIEYAKAYFKAICGGCILVFKGSSLIWFDIKNI